VPDDATRDDFNGQAWASDGLSWRDLITEDGTGEVHAAIQTAPGWQTPLSGYGGLSQDGYKIWSGADLGFFLDDPVSGDDETNLCTPNCTALTGAAAAAMGVIDAASLSLFNEINP